MRAAKAKAGCYQGSNARAGFACGGRVKRADGGSVMSGDDMTVAGGKPKPRLDRAPRGKKGGETNVNVIVAPKPDMPSAPVMPMGAAASAPPPSPPPMMPPPGGAPMGMSPGLPMRARGGRVNKWEGSPKDMAEDNQMAQKRGMTMPEWEMSPADRMHDAGKRMAPKRK